MVSGPCVMNTMGTLTTARDVDNPMMCIAGRLPSDMIGRRLARPSIRQGLPCRSRSILLPKVSAAFFSAACTRCRSVTASSTAVLASMLGKA